MTQIIFPPLAEHRIGGGELISRNAQKITLNQEVKLRPLLHENLVLAERLGFGGGPLHTQDISKLEAAGAIHIVLKTVLAELEHGRERFKRLRHWPDSWGTDSTLPVRKRPLSHALTCFHIWVRAISAWAGSFWRPCSQKRPIFQVMIRSRRARVIPTYNRRSRSAAYSMRAS